MKTSKFVSPLAIKRLPDTNEWRVSPRIAALKAQGATPLDGLRGMAERIAYYTDDKKDARNTGAFMLRQMRKNGNKFDAIERLTELNANLSQLLLTNPDRRPGALEAIKRWKARQAQAAVSGPSSKPWSRPPVPAGAPMKYSR